MRVKHMLPSRKRDTSVKESCCDAGQGVLGVFQKLVASRAHDAEGFRILDALLQHLPLDTLQPYLPTVRPRTADR